MTNAPPCFQHPPIPNPKPYDEYLKWRMQLMELTFKYLTFSNKRIFMKIKRRKK